MIILIVLLVRLVLADAAIDCKAIDSTQFKESFQFKYSGGSAGLMFTFLNDDSEKKFSHEECPFEIKDLKKSEYGARSYKRMLSPNKLNKLDECTKYGIKMTIINVSSKKSFDYENFVATRPNKTTNIALSVQSVIENSADLVWKTNSRGCLQTYDVTVRNKRNAVVYNVTNIATLSHNLTSLPPGDLTVQVTGWDDKGSTVISNAVNFTIVSNELHYDYYDDIEVFLNATEITAESVKLSWSTNFEDIKDLVYHLKLHDSQGNSVINKNTSAETSQLVKRLKACYNYTASVTVLAQEKSIEFTTKAKQPSKVRSINFTSNDTHSMLSWLPPKEHHACVTNYTIVWEGNDDDLISSPWIASRNATTLVVDKLPYAKTIAFHVYANWSTSNYNNTSEASKSFEYFSADHFNVENVREFRLSATEVQVLWSFNSSYSSVFKEFRVTMPNGEKQVTKNAFVNFAIDACAEKNYTVIIACISGAGTVGGDVTYQTHLDDDDVQLSAVSDTDIKVEQTDETIAIEWTPNAREQLCIAHYEVDFLGNVSIYEQPRMEIHKFSPCVTYQVTIAPVSKSGRRGVEKVFDFDTKVTVPSKLSAPVLSAIGNRDMTLSVSTSEDFKRCLLMKPTVIEMTCNSKTAASMNITKMQTDFKINVQNLHPNTRYRCSAKMRNEVGESPSSDEAEFVTRQESPQAPENVTIAFTQNNTIAVKWRANNSTGFADYFNVHVILVKSLNEISAECHKNSKSVTIIESSTEQATITDLLPYSSYKLKILASNTYGKSNFSKEMFFNTLPTRPTQPRDAVVKFERKNDTSLSALITWKPPCFMNGVFTLYTVSIHGQRTGLSDHKDHKATSIHELKFPNMRMGYKYEVEIQAVSQDNVYGDVLKHSFVAPSGIPLAEDLKDWTTLGNSVEKVDPANIEVFMKRRVFISSIGDIRGIIFLVFLRNCHDLPQPQFGYRNSSNIQLPQAINGDLNCSVLYEQTDFLPNPLDYNEEMESEETRDLEVYNMKFTLGESKCGKQVFKYTSKHCNGPLKPSESYGLMVRVLTRDAFRDTEPIFFETNGESFFAAFLYTKHAIPAVVIACVVIAMFISLVTCVICCWMTRRQKRIEKEKEAAEAADNLFSFTSYCVVDKNPALKTQFDPLL